MRSLIIGAAGFVGGYLIRELSAAGQEVHATHLPNETVNVPCSTHVLDIMVQDDITALLKEVEPDVIYHLAAQSSVAVSWKKPQLTAQVNVIGAINVFEGIRASGLDKVRTVVIGSGEQYGFIRPDACPLDEDEPLHPGNIYAATKACQESIGMIYSRSYGMDMIFVRAFNHSGPGQSDMFVISDFCRQIADIEAGNRENVMRVGNLSAKRDFTDVRDVVRAYRLLGGSGKKGKVYNVGRGKAVPISYILETAVSMAKTAIRVETDQAKMRASDIPIIEPDVSEIFNDAGWEARITLEQTIADTLGYWRDKV